MPVPELEQIFKDLYLHTMKQYALKDHEAYVRDHAVFRDTESIREFALTQGLDIIVVPKFSGSFAQPIPSNIPNVSTSSISVNGVGIHITLTL